MPTATLPKLNGLGVIDNAGLPAVMPVPERGMLSDAPETVVVPLAAPEDFGEKVALMFTVLPAAKV